MAPPAGLGYHLVWSDDFKSLDTTKWEVARYSKDKYYWLPCATKDNVFTSNGNLVLRIKNGTCPGDSNYHYNAGIVSTRKSWTYGYFEIRAKLPPGKNINASFFLLGDGWDSSREMDVVETGGYYDRPYKIYMTYHFPTSTKEYLGPDHSADFHTFGLEWTRDILPSLK